MNDLVLPGGVTRSSALDIRAQVNLVQEVMRGIMKVDVHYGKIPGTPKPTLYKAGAEVLCVTFHIAPTYITEDLSDGDVTRYRITCIGTHQSTGIVLGHGMGECSGAEEKYKWRAAVCDEEFDETPAHLRRVKFAKKYQGGIEKKRQVRTEQADLANTVLKMATKRAFVAMTLNVTATSDIFAQDIEDLPPELIHDDNGQPEGDPELAKKWVAKALATKTNDELKAVWAEGVREIRGKEDGPAYDQLKAVVETHGKLLREPAGEAFPDGSPSKKIDAGKQADLNLIIQEAEDVDALEDALSKALATASAAEDVGAYKAFQKLADTRRAALKGKA